MTYTVSVGSLDGDYDGATHLSPATLAAALNIVSGISVKSRSITSPPRLPAFGDRYIVAAPAIKGWTGRDNLIAVWVGDDWAYITPIDSLQVLVEEDQNSVKWSQASNAWLVIGSESLSLRVLTSDETAQNIGTAQPWFPSTGTATLLAGTYLLDGVLYLTTGTTSHSLLLKFDSGTATFASFSYFAIAQSVLENANALAQTSTWTTSAGANTVLAASTVAARWVRIVGVVRVSVAGTFVPEFRFSAAPGGSNIVKANSYIRLALAGQQNLTSIGSWA